jgi:hypothetical protein
MILRAPLARADVEDLACSSKSEIGFEDTLNLILSGLWSENEKMIHHGTILFLTSEVRRPCSSLLSNSNALTIWVFSHKGRENSLRNEEGDF